MRRLAGHIEGMRPPSIPGGVAVRRLGGLRAGCACSGSVPIRALAWKGGLPETRDQRGRHAHAAGRAGRSAPGAGPPAPERRKVACTMASMPSAADASENRAS